LPAVVPTIFQAVVRGEHFRRCPLWNQPRGSQVTNSGRPGFDSNGKLTFDAGQPPAPINSQLDDKEGTLP